MCVFTHDIIIATVYAAQADRDASDHSPHAAIRCVVWRLYAGLYCESARSVHKHILFSLYIALFLSSSPPPPISFVNSERVLRMLHQHFGMECPIGEGICLP